MCTFVAEILTLQNVSIMTTDFYEDWPHSELRLRLEFSVNADELDELYEYIESSELSEHKFSRVFQEFKDFLTIAKSSIKEYQILRYRDNETN
jgi:hypothetical protein